MLSVGCYYDYQDLLQTNESPSCLSTQNKCAEKGVGMLHHWSAFSVSWVKKALLKSEYCVRAAIVLVEKKNNRLPRALLLPRSCARDWRENEFMFLMQTHVCAFVQRDNNIWRNLNRVCWVCWIAQHMGGRCSKQKALQELFAYIKCYPYCINRMRYKIA